MLKFFFACIISVCSKHLWEKGRIRRPKRQKHADPQHCFVCHTISYRPVHIRTCQYRPHPCTTCQEDFASSEDLVQHLATRHDGAGIAASCDDVYRDSQLDKPFQCCNPGCGLYFKTLTGKSHCLTLNFHGVAPKFVWKGTWVYGSTYIKL